MAHEYANGENQQDKAAAQSQLYRVEGEEMLQRQLRLLIDGVLLDDLCRDLWIKLYDCLVQDALQYARLSG